MKLSKLFSLNLKKFAYIIVVWIVAVVLHNVVSALFGVEDAIFFIIAIFVIPLYFLIASFYSLIKLINKK